MPFHRGEQLRRPDGFAQVIVHARLQEPFPIALERMRSEGDDRQVFARLGGADGGRQFNATHLRHLHVEQYHIDALASQPFQRLTAIVRAHDLVPLILQHRRDDFLADRIILHE